MSSVTQNVSQSLVQLEKDCSSINKIISEVLEIQKKSEKLGSNFTLRELEAIQRKLNQAAGVLKPYEDPAFSKGFSKEKEAEMLISELNEAKKSVQGFQNIFRIDPLVRLKVEEALTTEGQFGMPGVKRPGARQRRLEPLPIDAGPLKSVSRVGVLIKEEDAIRRSLESESPLSLRIDTPRDESRKGSSSPLSRVSPASPMSLASIHEDHEGQEASDDDTLSVASSMSAASSPRGGESPIGSPLKAIRGRRKLGSSSGGETSIDKDDVAVSMKEATKVKEKKISEIESFLSSEPIPAF
jgi:hypothetical protein